jgi:Fe2+ or Zn2+ uptake regulation protein
MYGYKILGNNLPVMVSISTVKRIQEVLRKADRPLSASKVRDRLREEGGSTSFEYVKSGLEYLEETRQIDSRFIDDHRANYLGEDGKFKAYYLEVET